MKKCPFCKADIADNARFCLYCMKPLYKKEVLQPLQKKRPWWPFAAVGVLLAVLIALVLLRPWETDLPAQGVGGEGASAVQTTESQKPTDASTQDTQSADGGQQEDIPVEDNLTTPETTDPRETPQQIPNQDGQQLPEETKPEETKPEETEPSQPETPDETLPPATEPTKEPETTPPEQTQPEPEAPASEVVYTYRTAQAGDDFSAHYTNSGNDIVITGIAQQAADGVYDIPSYIDGKRVVAIVANAFYGSNAKVVYVPATLRSIWNYAFNGCALTDIYFTHNIYIEGDAFYNNPVVLTIHCPQNCQDRNFRYYKNKVADDDGLTWEEWNG